MINPSIYKLNDKHFDMNKLEHVSEVQVADDLRRKFCFRYQINGFVYDSDSNTNRSVTEEEREKLIKEWHNFCGEEII